MEKRNKTSQYKEKNFWSPTVEKPIIEEKIQVEEIVEPTIQNLEPFNEYNVSITYSNLRVRREPNENAEILYFINDKNKIYHILEEKNGFGKIAENEWIMLKFTKKEG